MVACPARNYELLQEVTSTRWPLSTFCLQNLIIVHRWDPSSGMWPRSGADSTPVWAAHVMSVTSGHMHTHAHMTDFVPRMFHNHLLLQDTWFLHHDSFPFHRFTVFFVNLPSNWERSFCLTILLLFTNMKLCFITCQQFFFYPKCRIKAI